MQISNNILVDFKMLINLDIGLFKLIKEKFSSSDCFDSYIINNTNIETMIYRLINEKYSNMIDLIKSDEYKDFSTENLYDTLIEKYYDEVYEKSITTDLLNLMNAYIMSNVVLVTILCKNKQEQQLINSVNSKFHTLIFEEDMNIEDYDSIFLKEYKDIVKFKNVQCKNIFIANIQNNLDNKNMPILEISAVMGKSNNIYTVELYDKKLNPMG